MANQRIRILSLILILLLLPVCIAAAEEEKVAESLLILVNKTHPLPDTYMPEDLVEVNVTFAENVYPERKQLRVPAAEALEKMFEGALADGIELIAVSGFRSYHTQAVIYEKRLEQAGQEYVDVYIAQPGCSEHQSGLAMDLGTQDSHDLTEAFADTEAYAWLSGHAAEYGFLVRYPKDGTESTGYAYEPWHVRFVGEAAKEIAESGLTLEDWYDRRSVGTMKRYDLALDPLKRITD